MENLEILNLDNIYVRVNRNNEWKRLCFSDLTEEEQTKYMNTLSIKELQTLCINLSDILRFGL